MGRFKRGKIFFIFGIAAFGLWGTLGCARRSPARPVYQDPRQPLEKRVNDLVARMTLEEKVSQMVNAAAAIPQLGIPEYNWWNEGLHGVARAGLATVFPQAIGLAATWDTDLMLRVATAISDEARAKYHEFIRRGKRGLYQGLTFWSPNINLFRDPRWGRGMETYGEDPYLTGQMGVAFIRGMQGNDPKYLKTVATPKHYVVHSGPEPDRHAFDAVIDERDFRESYLPHFQACVEEAKAFSVMCAYNRVLGEACCGSARLLTDILRKDWGFEGYVVSDCDAVNDILTGHKLVASSPEAAALAVKSGCDLNCGSEYKSLVEAVRKGFLSEKEIDVSVKRLFRARFKLGMFDPEEFVPYAQIPYAVVDSPRNRALALEAARKSIVLLKNEKNILPLSKSLKTIAVVGPNADDVEVLLGNYNGNPLNPVTPLRGIIEKVGPETRILYALGCDWARNMPSLEGIPAAALTTTENGKRVEGLRGEYFNNRDLTGEPAFVRVDKIIDFNWWDSAPDAGFDPDNFGVRWTGEIVVPTSGTYAIGGEGFNGFRIFIDDKPLVSFNGTHHPRKTYKAVDLVRGRVVKIKIEFFERAGDASIRLLWRVPGKDLKKEALEKAKMADAVILCLGLSPRLEGEEMDVPVEGFSGGDRQTLDLPAVQEDLLRALAETGKPVILVLLNGSAVAVNRAEEEVAAIVEAWYPGQAAGQAIADVLFGDANPGGRLPVTFYRSADQLPPFKDYRMQGRTYRYFEGQPLYPFGYGLSFTRFEYANLRLPQTARKDEPVVVAVDVRNSGDRAGEEIVQVYVRDSEASVPVPLRSLQGFKRIQLNPGETQTVRLTLVPEQFSLIDRNFRRTVEPGMFEISVGGIPPGYENRTGLTTGVLSGRMEVR
jgi:beta-glucosidase